MNDQPLSTSHRVPSPASTSIAPLFAPARLLPLGAVEAQRLLGDARRILQEAEAKAQDMERASRERGEAEYTAARERGEREGRERMEALLESATREFLRFRQQAEADVTRVGTRLAAALLEAELSTSPAGLAGLVSAVLGQAKWARNVVVVMHPGDVTAVEHALDRLRARVPAADAFAVRPDPDLPPRSFIVRTEMGEYRGGSEAAADALRRKAEESS